MGQREEGQSERHCAYGNLRKVIVRKPDQTFAVECPDVWNYTGTPDLRTAQREHDGLVKLLKDAGAEVCYHDVPLPKHADSVFVFDPVLIIPGGAVVLRMGKSLRRGEETALADKLLEEGISIISRLSEPGMVEGGDLLWLDEETLVAGRSFRTNVEGIEQLESILGKVGIRLEAFDLPYLNGPSACLHLLSLISILDWNFAVVYSPLLPVALWEELRQRGFELVEVPEQEFATMGPNVLALGPRKCVALEGNPVTRRRLEAAGCEVFTYSGRELSLKAEGGPTCLTLPLVRETPNQN